jgi:hypothetical protein
MTDEPPKKKSLAGLGRMLEKAAAEQKAVASPPQSSTAAVRIAGPEPLSGITAENRGYEITFRKKSSS